MNTQPESQTIVSAPESRPTVRCIGLGTAGIRIVEHLARETVPGVSYAVFNTEVSEPTPSVPLERRCIGRSVAKWLGTGGDPEQARRMAEENFGEFQSACQGAQVVIAIAGLGGGTGSGLCPVLVRAAKEAGALMIVFAVLPFACEPRRLAVAEASLMELKEVADGVVCFANQRVFKWLDENTSLLEIFKVVNEFVATGVRGFLRLLSQKGLIELHFAEVCALLKDKNSESVLAVAEGLGATRSREAVEKLLAHPVLEEGKLLKSAETVLLSITSGPDLTMAEVNRIVQEIGRNCEQAQVLMGAVVDETYRERLGITLIATRKDQVTLASENRAANPEDFRDQLLPRNDGPRHESRFVPPPPALTAEQARDIVRHRTPSGRRRPLRMRQGQLPLEIVSKGRFDKSEPTIHKGEDLDVPTYLRRGILLN